MKNKIVFCYRNLIIIFGFLLVSSSLFAEDNATLSSININGISVSSSNWNKIEIGVNDSISFGFNTDNPEGLSSEILYKVFLNGVIIEPDQVTKSGNSITIKNLSKGSYILKIQPYSENWEAQPVILPFFVQEKSTISEKEIEMEPEFSSFDYKSFILYGLIALSVIQLFVITLLVLKRKSSQNNIYRPDRNDISKDGKHAIQTDSNKVNRELISALDEMQYSYNQLKQEYLNLKDTNSQLQNQIYTLKENVKSLEDANSELSNQKEKLMQSKQQLELLQEQKDKLFAIAIHDIKNPAAAIKSYVELLESYDLNASEQQEIMLSLVDTSSKIVSLAQQMSVIIAAQKPEPVLQLESGNIKRIIDSICNRNYAYAKKKNIKLLNNSSPNTPETQLDPNKIEEVVDNLINNAIKFAPDGTVVQVRTYFNERKISVEIEDNGVGLSDNDIKKAFNKGAKLSAKPTAGEPSSGIGLWIVKNIIEEHGGKVFVKSKVGVGSTFSFELPIVRKN